jgi:hypothetical protein
MNNQEIIDLAKKLYDAADEDAAEKILKGIGLWDESNWKPLGGENMTGQSIIGSQQDNPISALVEKIVNSVDAVLTRECLKSGINPEAPEAPNSIIAAQEKYFGIHGGQLTNIGTARRKELADNIHLIASGYKSKNPSIAIIDRGEGQEPNMFENTLLSLVRGVKEKIRFVQGKWGMGGTGVLSFGSPNHKLQLIISKKNHEINGDHTSDWGVTLVRRFVPKDNVRVHTYKYLAPNNKILSFKKESLAVIPIKTKEGYSFDPLESGTIVKLFDYDFTSVYRGGRARDRIFRNLQDRISTLLPSIAIPFLVTDLRFPEEDSQRTFNPLNVRLDEDKRANVEYNFTAAIMVKNEVYDCRIFLFVKDLSKSKDQGKATYAPSGEGILFLCNGQTQGIIPQSYFSNIKIGLGELSDSLLVLIDTSKTSNLTQSELFMNSRDRLRQCPQVKEIQVKLGEILKDDKGLNDAKQKRISEKNEHALKNSDSMASILEKLISSNPMLSNLFLKGNKISSPIDQRLGGEVNERYEGKVFPTYFSLKYPHPESKPRGCEKKRTVRLTYETDAANEYFSRDSDSGNFEMYVNDQPASFDSFNLSNGIGILNFEINEAYELNSTYKITTRISDISCSATPFEDTFWIQILEYRDQNGGKSKPRRPKPDIDEPGKRKLSDSFSLPKTYQVSKEDWSTHDMNGKSALTAIYNGDEEGWLYYVNIDNDYLLHHSIQNKRKDIDILRKKYSLALTLIGLSLIHNKKEDEFGDESNFLEGIKKTTSDISMILMPLIDDIGKEDSSLLIDFEASPIDDDLS